jgi:hypothetical protein
VNQNDGSALTSRLCVKDNSRVSLSLCQVDRAKLCGGDSHCRGAKKVPAMPVYFL